jgi:hypothetical protein
MPAATTCAWLMFTAAELASGDDPAPAGALLVANLVARASHQLA